jgi:hypothetical protein
MENYPIFEKEYITKREYFLHNDFEKYLNYTDNMVNYIQHKSPNKTEIPLTFYPIAKNIRIPASYMAINIMNGKSSYINNMPRNGEPNFWKHNQKMGDWFPWLWARNRIPGNFTNADGWKYYFKSFFSDKPMLTAPNNETIKPPDDVSLFFVYLSCIKYTFWLNNQYMSLMENYKTQIAWPADSLILAVQIRRGETCTKDGSITDRPFLNLNQYIEAIDKMLLANNYEYIYISTDSDYEIDEIKRVRPEWKLLYLPIDRSQFFRMETRPIDLEIVCSMEPNRIPFVVDSAIADLFFISQCKGYISTISVSEFSRCGWFLQIAMQKQITPYIDMNDDILDMRKRDKLLLL